MTNHVYDELDDNHELFRDVLSRADIRDVEAPADLVERVRARLQERMAPVPSGKGRMAGNRTRRAGLVAVCAGIGLLTMSVVFWLRPNRTWAQIAEAVRSQPWIHMQAEDPNGQKREVWLSFSRDVAAIRNSGVVRFDDYRANVRHEFDPQAKKLLRLPISDKASFDSLAAFFQVIFRGDADVGDRLAEDRIVKREQRQVVSDGKSWLELTLGLQRGNQVAVAIVRVDPESNLPVFLRLSAGGDKLRYDFDYPPEGPADIYALGVPGDLVVENRVPSADLAQILKTMEAGRRDLDNYLAVFINSTNNPERLIWRNGDKWRVEVCRPSQQVPAVEEPAAGADPSAWWRERLKRIDTWAVLVCDGHRVHRAKFELKDGASVIAGWEVARTVPPGEGRNAALSFGDSSSYLVDVCAYPQLSTSPPFTTNLDPQGKNGPPGSVLVEMVASGAMNNAYRKSQYWLDPQHGYAVVKLELSDCPAVDNDPQARPSQKRDIHEFSDFRQSPRGVWYPTRVCWKNAIGDKNDRGEWTCQDLITHFYIDFHAELPEELFTPTTRERRP